MTSLEDSVMLSASAARASASCRRCCSSSQDAALPSPELPHPSTVVVLPRVVAILPLVTVVPLSEVSVVLRYCRASSIRGEAHLIGLGQSRPMPRCVRDPRRAAPK